jgi:hypothetical protein
MSSWSRTHVPGRTSKTDKTPVIPYPPKKHLSHTVYSTPKVSDTVVILVFFNPAKSFRIIQNLLYIKQLLDSASIPYFIGELAGDKDSFVFPSGTPHIFQFRSGSHMFYKENLINCVISRAPEYAKYVILDADVIFDEPAWVDAISEALNTYSVLQPYQFVHQLNIRFQVETTKASLCYTSHTLGFSGGHTGYVWAFRRDWWLKNGGLYMYALIGGGDKCLAHQVGIEQEWIPKPYESDVGTRPTTVMTTYLPFTIWHLPHGSLLKRKYIERATTLQDTMRSLGIERLRDAVEVNSDGVFEWKARYKPVMNTLMLNYFNAREDDGWL